LKGVEKKFFVENMKAAKLLYFMEEIIIVS